MDKLPAIEKHKENPWCPEGWTDDDRRRASMEWNAFTSSRAWHWIGHYLGVQQRYYEHAMANSKPSSLTHMEFVELGSRINEIIQFWRAAEVLSGYENVRERSPDIGQEG